MHHTGGIHGAAGHVVAIQQDSAGAVFTYNIADTVGAVYHTYIVAAVDTLGVAARNAANIAVAGNSAFIVAVRNFVKGTAGNAADIAVTVNSVVVGANFSNGIGQLTCDAAYIIVTTDDAVAVTVADQRFGCVSDDAASIALAAKIGVGNFGVHNGRGDHTTEQAGVIIAESVEQAGDQMVSTVKIAEEGGAAQTDGCPGKDMSAVRTCVTGKTGIPLARFGWGSIKHSIAAAFIAKMTRAQVSDVRAVRHFHQTAVRQEGKAFVIHLQIRFQTDVFSAVCIACTDTFGQIRQLRGCPDDIGVTLRAAAGVEAGGNRTVPLLCLCLRGVYQEQRKG